jgi:hypothetical protein
MESLEKQSVALPDVDSAPGSPTRDTTLDELTEAICRRGLGTAAVFLLESVRPLNFIGSQAMHAFTPLASVVFDPKHWSMLAEALEDRTTIDRLIKRIEAKEQKTSHRS